MGCALTSEDVLREIQRRRLLTRARITSSGEVEGGLEIRGQDVTIRVRFTSTLTLPTLWLEPPDALGVLPHLDHEICFQEKEGLILDRRDPGGVLAFAIDKARKVLVEGLTGRNAEDFAAEFATIWDRHKDCQTLYSLLEVRRAPRSVIVLSASDTKTHVADDEDTIRSFYGGGTLRRDRTIRRAIYLTLKEGVSIVPPPPRGPMWTAEEVRRNLGSALTDSARNLVERLQDKRPNRIEYVFFSLPTGHEGHSLFGLKFVGAKGRHPLAEGAEVRKVVPLRMRRFDRSFLVPRGGAMTSLEHTRLLVVGCGSVGGLIVQGLSHSGIGRIDLVDPETLNEENTYRHVLGREYWGRNKAEALADFVGKNVPYVVVEAYQDPVQGLIESERLELHTYDLVAIALGDPTVEMHLNEILHGLARRPFAVHAWVEPLGLGGHLLLTGTPGGGGCFECALTSVDDPKEDRLRDRLSFAKSGQGFGRELAGCGSLHTPYAFGDASRTAERAVRLGLSALSGREPFNAVESWKGSPDDFRTQGYTTSDRFDLGEDDLNRQRRWYPNRRCPICAGRSRAGS